MAQHHRLIIVGSGPAGYTAAVYAARAALTPVLITGVEVGGQMTTTTDVDNWPGDDRGVQGPELMERMKRHAERFGTKLITIRSIVSSSAQRPFRLFCGKDEYTCDALIVATGASAKYLGLNPRTRTRAAACRRARPATGSSSVTNPWPSSAAAIRRSKKPSTREHRITSDVVHRRNEFRAEQIMIDKLVERSRTGNVEILYDTCSTRWSATIAASRACA